MSIRDLAETVAACTEQRIAGGPNIEHRTEHGIDVIEVNAMADSLDVPAGQPMVDVVFFQVAFTPAADALDPDTLVGLIADAEHGEFADVSLTLLRLLPHSYITLGGWLGDQGVALCFMALCQHKGIGKIITIRDLYGPLVTDDQVRTSAGLGNLFLRLNAEENAETPEPALTAAR